MTKGRLNHGLVRGGLVGGCLAIVLMLGLAVSGIFGATASPSAGTGFPASAVAGLASIAEQEATINGDANPTSASVVETTHAAALTSATPGDLEPDSASESVYLITMTGNFTGYGFSTAPGVAPPVGSYLSVVVDAGTFSVTDEGISQNPPPVSPSSLGPTMTLAVGTTSH
jgi:hypothetical protein